MPCMAQTRLEPKASAFIQTWGVLLGVPCWPTSLFSSQHSILLGLLLDMGSLS